MEKHLHIICLDVPYPVDHGGIFDLFYKIVALHKQQIKIHLHCFEYGRGPQEELDKYCTEITYYKRILGVKGFSFFLPYIVNSRSNEELAGNLAKDDYPILLEGIHCTYLLYKNRLLNRKVFVRLHNVEFMYYRQLARAAPPGVKKMYYWLESRLLKKYEHKISSRAIILAVAGKDIDCYKKEFQPGDIRYLPVFLPFESVTSRHGKGSYCLYQGNLAVAENNKAVTWLLKKVFQDLAVPFVIAGKHPSEKLKRLVHKNKHTCLIANPVDEEITDLINKAHINVLPSFNATGVKIKLLSALFKGRHCLVNTAAVEGTGLNALCFVADDAAAFKKNILTLHTRLFTPGDMETRRQVLSATFAKEENARRLIKWIWE